MARAGDPTEHWIAIVDGVDTGWIQLWDCRTEPAEVAPWLELGLAPDAGGIDYLLGTAGARGRGVGSAMIAVFAADVFRRHPGLQQLAAAPYEANQASWRALARAGFRHLGDVPDEVGTGRLMVLDRPAG